MNSMDPNEEIAFSIRRAGDLRRRAQSARLDKRAALLRRARWLIEGAKSYRKEKLGGRPLTWFVRDAQHYVENYK